MKKLDDLFIEVEEIDRAYQEELKTTGEGYNIFQILGLSYNEVRTHTAILTDLLNPIGTHGQGNAFLELFLNHLDLKSNSNWKLRDFYKKDKMLVEKEKFIGLINNDFTEGGSIDLIIKNMNGQAIIIENKINAGDQPSQLLRYYNNAKKSFKNGFELLYLTLDGRSASDSSKGGVLDESSYRRISYSNDVIPWLEECKPYIVDHLLLHGTITQYTYLVKLLTGNTKYNAMEKEIQKKIVSSQSSFETAKIVSEQYNNIVYNIIPSNKRNAIFSIWKKRFECEDNRILLFTYKDFRVYTSISEEEKWHFQIWPVRIAGDKEIFGVAKDESISFIGNAITSIPDFTKFSNHNYTVWLYFQDGVDNIDVERKLTLLSKEGSEKWAMGLFKETEFFLRYFVEQILNTPMEIQQEIFWTENVMIQNILNSFGIVIPETRRPS